MKPLQMVSLSTLPSLVVIIMTPLAIEVLPLKLVLPWLDSWNSSKISVCGPCWKTKLHQFSYELSVHKFHSPLELVYSDGWGPAPIISRSGFRYYMYFIDAYSRYTCIYLLANKSQVFQAFQQ